MGTRRRAPAYDRDYPAPAEIVQLEIWWDRNDPSNPGWAWLSCELSDYDGGLDMADSGELWDVCQRRTTSLQTLRRRLARSLGASYPRAARNDAAWEPNRTGSGWVWIADGADGAEGEA